MENNKNSEYIKVLAITILPVHLFFKYYPLMRKSLNITLLDGIYTSLIPKLGMMGTQSFLMNILVMVLLLIYAITTPLNKDKEINKSQVIKNTFLAIIIILVMAALFHFLQNYIWFVYFYISGLIIGYYIYLTNISMFLKIFSYENTDIFNLEKETFPQMSEKIETPHSINIPYFFYYNKRWNQGWLNFVNPFRAILVAGSPGSGKSFGTINLAIHQLIHKGYCLYVYDFKLPTLAIETINALWHYKELIKSKYGSIESWEKKENKKFPKYYQVNFKDPKTSNRINPIASHLIRRQIDATESAKFIMQGLKGTSAGSDGGGNQFFDQSAENLLTAIIYYLKRKSNQYGKEFCSLPHVIELLLKPYEILFSLLMSDSDVKKLASSFNNAFEKGVFDQLQGQVDSLVIPMGQLADENIYWVFTGNDFSLNISDPENPSILTIGNDPETDKTYGILLSLLNGKLTKTINKQGQLPLGIIIDELPTLPFDSVANLIATARSNKVACILGIQDIAQFVLNYGEQKANMIVGMVGSILTGQIRGELAKTISECIGKINQEQISESLSQTGNSFSISTQLNEAVTVSTIATLSQGEMVGTISDDFAYPMKYRRFHGKIDATSHEASPTTVMPIKKIPTLNQDFLIKANETEQDLDTRIAITIRNNKKSIEDDILLIQNLETARFEIQQFDDINNLTICSQKIKEFTIKVNNYEDDEYAKSKFEEKEATIKAFYEKNISNFVYLSEAEIEAIIVDEKIQQSPKKIYTDFNSIECKALQQKYTELLTIIKTPLDIKIKTESILAEIGDITKSPIQLDEVEIMSQYLKADEYFHSESDDYYLNEDFDE